MYYYLNGVLTVKENDFAVVECGGVGYKVKITYNTYKKLGELNTDTKIYTYLSVREDAMELYGFADEQEKRCYTMLIGVSGIGPKAAVSILSELTSEQFAAAVASGDIKAISAAQGVGAKGAGRIILELKDKIAKQDITFTESRNIPAAESESLSEAVSALVALGYSKAEAEKALKKADVGGLSVEEMIKVGLKELMKL